LTEKESKVMRKKVILSLLAVCLLGGCAGIDRTHESMVMATNPDRVRLQTEIRWINPQPNIRPVSADRMYVYCRIRNSAGADVDLRRQILDEIEAQGYRITRDIDEAQFTINADLRYFGETATKAHDAAVGSAIIGGAAGAVVGHQSGSTGEGAIIGAVAGALLGDIIDKRNKDRKISLIVDVTIGERIAGDVRTRRGSKSDQSVATYTGGQESGRSSAGSHESQSVELTEEFLYHTNRVIAKAERMNLTLPEAEPVLSRRLSRAIASSLP
jgi:hypothetical protein